MSRARLVRVAAAAVALLVLAPACTKGRAATIEVGAVYPFSGPQGAGGRDEFRGVQLAVDMVNDQGGVSGHPIALRPVDAPGAAAAAPAVQALHEQGVKFVLGSYGSTVSRPAALQADRNGMLFWETGAVGLMAGAGQGSLVFRVPPTGAVLGGSAISFVAKQLSPRLHRRAGSLRYAVAYVNDTYGTAVARGAIDEIHRLGLPYVGAVPYALAHLDPATVVQRIAALRPDVLFVSAYVDDGVALRRQMVRQRLPLVVNIGSSSSYCMPEFGRRLGADAVGVFASDKPDANALNLTGLTPAARLLLIHANTAFKGRYGESMPAASLAGFSAAWALFHDVMPHAGSMTPAAVAAAALRTTLPTGALPNGSGLSFAPPGTPDAGANVRAASVIWEWTSPDSRWVVWPPRFATAQLRVIPLPR